MYLTRNDDIRHIDVFCTCSVVSCILKHHKLGSKPLLGYYPHIEQSVVHADHLLNKLILH